jgi:hypothetical protein
MSGGPSNIPIQVGECFKAKQDFEINVFGGKEEISNGDIFKCVDVHINEKFPGIYGTKYLNGKFVKSQGAFDSTTFNMIEKVACPTEGGRRRKTRKSHKRRRYSRRR